MIAQKILTYLLLINTPKDANYHLEQIRIYDEYMRNPKNSKTSQGYVVTSPHPRINKDEHLEALLKLNAIQKLDYKSKKLLNTKHNIRKWMQYSAGRQDILEASADANEVGKHPLTFTFWYLPSAQDSVNEFINELEKQQKTPHSKTE